MVKRSDHQQRKVELAAKCAYGAHRGFLLAQEQPKADWPEWDDLEPERRESLIDAARYISRNAVTPEDCHAKWLKERMAAGWTAGRTYNRKYKWNPHLVHWSVLPQSARGQFELFWVCVRSLLDKWDD